MRAVYKLPVIGLAVQTASGREIERVFLRREGEAGFLLSPYLSESVAMEALYSTRWKEILGAEQVSRMAIGLEDTSASADFESDYSIEFFGLEYPHGDVSSAPGMDRYVKFRQIARQVSVLHSDGDVYVGADEDGKVVLKAPAVSQLLIPVPTGARTFRFGFGMLYDSYLGDKKTDGTQFGVLAVDQLSGTVHAQQLFAGAGSGPSP